MNNQSNIQEVDHSPTERLELRDECDVLMAHATENVWRRTHKLREEMFAITQYESTMLEFAETENNPLISEEYEELERTITLEVINILKRMIAIFKEESEQDAPDNKDMCILPPVWKLPLSKSSSHAGEVQNV